ncbi:hypothetical protein HGM15179_008356 [Zosterops borbonicus]|uniref:Uncharacterized protein n=1 Tax=Zosterops borbonicus TaxID=364589 RepID=A0A8K1GIM5_9PASS|nr:hypothetical protein HGM15179_008356 [Zosterops borbonicus]
MLLLIIIPKTTSCASEHHPDTPGAAQRGDGELLSSLSPYVFSSSPSSSPKSVGIQAHPVPGSITLTPDTPGAAQGGDGESIILTLLELPREGMERCSPVCHHIIITIIIIVPKITPCVCDTPGAAQGEDGELLSSLSPYGSSSSSSSSLSPKSHPVPQSIILITPGGAQGGD